MQPFSPRLTATGYCSPDYKNKHVSLSKTVYTIDLVPEAGEHRITFPAVEIGARTSFGNASLMADISLWYNYEPAHNLITLCGNDLMTDDALRINTYPQGLKQKSSQPTYLVNNNACERNILWSHCTPLTPGLQDIMLTIAREFNSNLIQKAKESGFNVIVRTPLPSIPEDLYKKLCPVYHKGKFYEFYDETKDYGPDYVIGNFYSIFYGEIYLSNSEAFANVIGSSNDPKINGLSWIQLWKNQFGSYTYCTSYQNAGTPGGGLSPFTCTNNPVGQGLLGGHSILGQYATKVATGSNNVFIIPICSAHNNNDNVYMAALQCLKGVALHNYMQFSFIESAFAIEQVTF